MTDPHSERDAESEREIDDLRRKSKAELREETFRRQAEAMAETGEGEIDIDVDGFQQGVSSALDSMESLKSQTQHPESADDDDTGAGARLGDFEAVTEAQQRETNELFRLLHENDYMTTGVYDLTSDGQSTVVSLQIILPSSPGLPSDVGGGDGDGGVGDG